MQLNRLFTVTVLPFLAASSETLKPRDRNAYALETAPEVLLRLSNYKAENKATLTPSQNDFLDESQATVLSFDLNRANHLKETCAKVFQHDQCAYILTGKHVSLETEGVHDDAGAEKRSPECGCSTESDWCGDRIGPIWACKLGSCHSPGVWCGTLGFFNCNGICKPTCSIPCS
ncbi:hypothetical protein NLG97_g1770 [Lecanicillium saksenae]|uniref:Uncharacterized protein n=1 Tax=Lecanicillium saksenae TaxID=468837 RepID=A0ACC1R642_9HYPO|nr:hypothetical protein NLG97_g1770 [Lecanicillium saksenae]